MVACTSWFFLDLACTWSYISHSAFSTVSSSINSKESRNHDYFTVLVLAFGFVQSTKNIFTMVQNHFKKSRFYDRACEANSVNFQRFCAKNEYFLFFSAKIQMRLFKVIFKTLCIMQRKINQNWYCGFMTLIDVILSNKDKSGLCISFQFIWADLCFMPGIQQLHSTDVCFGLLCWHSSF